MTEGSMEDSKHLNTSLWRLFYMLGGENTWLSFFSEVIVDTYEVWMCVVFEIQEIFNVQEVTWYGKGTWLYTQYFVLSVYACNLSMNLISDNNVWYGLHLSLPEGRWHMPSNTKLCVRGWMGASEGGSSQMNTNDSALLIFEWFFYPLNITLVQGNMVLD